MNIYLGDLSVSEIERRAGVEFPGELKTFMQENHQGKASDIEKGKWHCFDIPFFMVCGDYDTAKFIHGYLASMSSQFKQPLQIGVAP